MLRYKLSVEEAKGIAYNLFTLYDKDKDGVLEPYELNLMLRDLYRPQKQKPQNLDFEASRASQHLDANKDGKVTLSDVESMVMKYFCFSNSHKMFDSEDRNFYFSADSYSVEGSLLDYVDKMEESKTQRFAEDLKKRDLTTTNFDAVERHLKRTRQIFSRFDTSRTGFVDKENSFEMMKAILGDLGFSASISNLDLAQIVDSVDLDQDGRISVAEIEAFVLKVLDNMVSQGGGEGS